MAQYCRYCEYANKNQWTCTCSKKQIMMTKVEMKRTNKCKYFKLNKVDVLRENVKGYRPTGRKIVQFGGMGVQVKLEDIINV